MDNQTSPPPPSPPAPTTVNSGIPSGISLDGVDNSYGAFLSRRWWIVLLIVGGSAALAAGLLVGHLNPFYGAIPLVLGMAYFKRSYENSLFKAFALSNHYNFQKEGELSNQAGLLFSLGHSRKYSDIVSGTYQTWPFLLLMYRYTIGYGRGSHTYDRAVMAVSFNVALPAFVLRRHNTFQILEEEGESLKNSNYTEKINLEGDFNKHFQVYIRPNTQVDVLSILAPDVMQMLIGLDKYELEMAESGEFYVYCHGYITKKQALIDIYTILEAIAAKIGRYATREKALQQLTTPPITPA